MPGGDRDRQYLAAHRPSLRLGVKEICRKMAVPTRSSAARDLAEYPRLERAQLIRETHARAPAHVQAAPFLRQSFSIARLWSDMRAKLTTSNSLEGFG